MTSGVRYSAGNARVRAMRGRLWTALDRGLLLRAGIDPDGRPLTGSFSELFPPLIQCYLTVMKTYPAVRPLATWMVRLHEIENVKLLWRSALRGRVPIASCCRPLQPLATVEFPDTALTPGDLVERLRHTPYGAIAQALRRSHATDSAAAEIGLDRWAWSALHHEARRLHPRESATQSLIRLLVIEHDLDLLRRGTAFGLDADLVAKATVLLATEYPSSALARLAAWIPGTGALAGALPPRLTRIVGGAADWDAAMQAVRRARLRECRRAFMIWPFQLAPAVALLLLREAQLHAAISLSAARTRGASAEKILPVALAASELET